MSLRNAWGCVIALALAAAAAAPGWAEDPAEPAPAAAEPGAHGLLWWNDTRLLERLPLEPKVRLRMDALYESYRKTLHDHPLPKLRAACFDALRKGDDAQARRESEAWAKGAAAVVHADAALKIGVLSLLSTEQRQNLVALSPRLIVVPWIPRAAWVAPGAPERDAAEPAAP